jgi:acylphosphatase
MTARLVLYSGRVQGVGFRVTARGIASGFDVAGHVRNLPDGRVELLAAGDPDEVDAFLAAIRASGLESLIHREESSEIAPPEGLRGFTITR